MNYTNMNSTFMLSVLAVLIASIAIMLYRMRDKIPARTMILVLLLAGSITLLMAYPVPRRKLEQKKTSRKVDRQAKDELPV